MNPQGTRENIKCCRLTINEEIARRILHEKISYNEDIEKIIFVYMTFGIVR